MAENRKYTVHLDINELERGTKMSSKDTELTGLWVKGTTIKDGATEAWEKFLMDWNAAEFIEKLEVAGIGAKVDIVMEKEGRFWNIKGVYTKGKASTPSVSTPDVNPQTGLPESGKPEPQQQEMFKPEQQVLTNTPGPIAFIPGYNQFAIEQAVALTTSMLQAGIIKTTKSSPTVIAEGVLALSDTIMAYLKGGGTSEPKSDASPLQSQTEEGDPGPEDDIPF